VRRSLFLALIVFTVLCTSAAGLDGHRKGFVIGGGIGFAPNGHWSSNREFSYTKEPFRFASGENHTGLAGQYIIGYGWDEKNILVYEGNAAFYKSLFFDQTITQGTESISWYHYFGNTGNTFYLLLGAGTYNFGGKEFDQDSFSGAVIIGGGYEFLRHWQAGVCIGLGKTTWRLIDINASHISILTTVILF